MANKMTQRDYFNEIIAVAKAADRNDLVEFAEGRIAALDKKSANRKPSKAQAENEGIKSVILEVLTDEGVTVTDLIKSDERFAEFSNQKMSALLRQLVADGKVAKTVEKGKAFFALA
jgi:hypothetical protein